MINKLPKKLCPDPGDFTGEFYQRSFKKITRILCNLFQKIEERTHPYSFYKASIILILIPKTVPKKRKLQVNIPHLNIDVKIFNKTLANQFGNSYKELTIHNE